MSTLASYIYTYKNTLIQHAHKEHETDAKEILFGANISNVFCKLSPCGIQNKSFNFRMFINLYIGLPSIQNCIYFTSSNRLKSNIVCIEKSLKSKSYRKIAWKPNVSKSQIVGTLLLFRREIHSCGLFSLIFTENASTNY